MSLMLYTGHNEVLDMDLGILFLPKNTNAITEGGGLGVSVGLDNTNGPYNVLNVVVTNSYTVLMYTCRMRGGSVALTRLRKITL